MPVIRKRLSESEGSPANIRVNPETGVVQSTIDGGTTWIDDPGADPRINPAFLMPPVEGSNARCAAAFGMVEGIREYVDGINDASNDVARISILVAAILLSIPGINIAYALALLAFDAINVLGIGNIVSAFTEEVYEDLLCIFFDNIDADGRISAAQIEYVREDIDSKIGDVYVTGLTDLFFSEFGFVGLTNNGFRLQDGDADCGCGYAWTLTYNAMIGDGGWVVYNGGSGWRPAPGTIWEAGVGWRSGMAYRTFGDVLNILGLRKVLNAMDAKEITVYSQFVAGIMIPSSSPYAEAAIESPESPIYVQNAPVPARKTVTGLFATAGGRVWRFSNVISYTNNGTSPTGSCLLTKIMFKGDSSPTPTPPSSDGWSIEEH